MCSVATWCFVRLFKNKNVILWRFILCCVTPANMDEKHRVQLCTWSSDVGNEATWWPRFFSLFFFFKYKETPFHRIIPQILPQVQSALRGKGRPKSERRLSDLWALARRAEKGSGAQKAAHRSQDQSSGLGFQFLANALHSKPGRDLGTFKVIKKLETIKKQWLKNHCYG